MKLPSFLRLVLCCLALTAFTSGQSVRLDDNSDWWSILRSDTPPPNARILKRRPPDSTFVVGNISLGKEFDVDTIIKKFGKVQQVDRGDGATGRSQLCYSSASKELHFIFEVGEVEGVAYLFDTGRPWNGEQLCAESTFVSKNTGTRNGLALGVTRERVIGLLGKPSLSTTKRLYYQFEYEITPSPSSARKLREENPDMSEEEFKKNYSKAGVTAIIDARFSAGRLTYLAVSRSEVF